MQAKQGRLVTNQNGDIQIINQSLSAHSPFMKGVQAGQALAQNDRNFETSFVSEDDSCFKVPKSIAKSKLTGMDGHSSLKHDTLSSQYLNMIMTKQKQHRKDTLMNCTP